jgi:DNA polymerase
MSKTEEYLKLVNNRKACRDCEGLTNPSVCEGGIHDRNHHIGPWSRWQGNLDAKLMIVGQEWGSVKNFKELQGCNGGFPTDWTLHELLASINMDISPPTDDGVGDIFLTNAVLCLKGGNAQEEVELEWFENCGRRHLKPLIDLIAPTTVITLGEKALFALLVGYTPLSWSDSRPRSLEACLKNLVKNILDFRMRAFRDVVEKKDGFVLGGSVLLFPMYHCGQKVLNMTRPLHIQREDWKKVEPAIDFLVLS